MKFQSKKHAAGYLAAMIDGEGCVDPRDRSVRIANTEEDIIDTCCVACETLGLKFSVNRYRNGCIVVRLGGQENMKLLAKVVSLGSERKSQLLEQAVQSYKREPYMDHGVTKERLQALISLGMTQREIADALGMHSHSNAQYWLEKFGLRTARA